MPRPGPKQVLGSALLIVSAVFTVILAFLGASDAPATRAEITLLAVLVLAAQGGSVWAFSGHGKADPTHAARSYNRLVRLGVRAANAQRIAESAYDSNSGVAHLRSTMGVLSTEFSWVQEGIVQSALDWKAFHPSAVIDVDRGEQNGDE